VTVVSWERLLAGDSGLRGPVNLTIGVFDGVHLGHRRLLSAITTGGSTPLVVTFIRSPTLVLDRHASMKPILTFPQKLERIEAQGAAWVVVIDFSEQLSRLSGKAFIGLLRENLTIEKIAIGYNFRFGKDRNADARTLREMFRYTKTEVHVAEPVLYGGSAVSSSRIRSSISGGFLREAGEMLSARHCIDLREVPMTGKSLPGALRITTMQRADIKQCLPKPGSYPVSCEAEAAAIPGRLTIRKDTVELELSGGGKIARAEFL
jgi:riboflavin kinase/FMN adenylyltransferase